MFRYFFACLSLVLAAPCSVDASEDVLSVANDYADGGGYNWTPENSGACHGVDFRGEEILAPGDGTFCCGFTFEVAMRVAEERELLAGKSVDEIRRFQKLWYGSTDEDQETLVVYAAEQLGVGEQVSHDQARPGDFLQIWRNNGSGHSVVFLGWVGDAERPDGFRYRSSQGSTDGIGNVTEYFEDSEAGSGKVVRSRAYFCRLNNKMTSSESSTIDALIQRGDYSEAERLLREAVDDPEAPATSPAAIQLEMLRRTRLEYPLSADDVLKQIRRRVPDATQADLERWTLSGALQSRTIDGEVKYFRRAAANLTLIDSDARSRLRRSSDVSDKGKKRFRLTPLIEELIAEADEAGKAEVFPVHHDIKYKVTVPAGHPRLRPGALVRAWLPVAQTYARQRNVQITRCVPADSLTNNYEAPHAAVFFTHTVEDPDEPVDFSVEYNFEMSGYAPRLDPSKVEPYDTESNVYQQDTAERLPHIAFTDEARALAEEIVGEETNPLLKARRIFRWVSENVPWVGEQEYCIIPSLSGKGISERRGDCGVQGMTFIALCRIAGVPARWQSGWQTQPGRAGLHDWSEIYIEPWGWLPVDASYGVRKHDDPRVADFLCGSQDPYRLIVNLDYAQDFMPAKTSYRSEPNDFQRGEVEIDGHNLYFDEWSWWIQIETTAPGNRFHRDVRSGGLVGAAAGG